VGKLQPTWRAEKKDGTRTKEENAGYRGTSESEGTREGLLAVVAEHSTDELVTSSGRWGTETQGTHFREGEAGHNVLFGGNTGDT